MARPELGRLYRFLKSVVIVLLNFLSPLAIRRGGRVPEFIPGQYGTYVSQKPKAGVEPCKPVRMAVEKGIVSGNLCMANNERKGTKVQVGWMAGTTVN